MIFVPRGGSDRHSPRNARVARALNEAGLATVLVNLLMAREEQEDRWTFRLRFDIGLLARRLIAITDWLKSTPMTRGLPIAYFAASTGAAAAMVAAAERPRDVAAMILRGGRPDLAGSALRRVRAPTLFIVGGADELVLELNLVIYERLVAEKELRVIAGAGHLFEEDGALDEVSDLARRWLSDWMAAPREAREANLHGA